MDNVDLYTSLVRVKKNLEAMREMRWFKPSLEEKLSPSLADINTSIHILEKEAEKINELKKET